MLACIRAGSIPSAISRSRASNTCGTMCAHATTGKHAMHMCAPRQRKPERWSPGISLPPDVHIYICIDVSIYDSPDSFQLLCQSCYGQRHPIRLCWRDGRYLQPNSEREPARHDGSSCRRAHRKRVIIIQTDPGISKLVPLSRGWRVRVCTCVHVCVCARACVGGNKSTKLAYRRRSRDPDGACCCRHVWQRCPRKRVYSGRCSRLLLLFLQGRRRDVRPMKPNIIPPIIVCSTQ